MVTFCWWFYHLCSSGVLAYNFLSFFCSVFSGFRIWIMLASMSLGGFPPLEFYEIVWEAEVLVLLGVFGKLYLWSHLVQDTILFICVFFFFNYCFNFIGCNLSIQVFWFFLIQLEDCLFLGIYPFCPDCPICWHIFVCNIFLTILCISLVLVIMFHFHSDFINLGAFFFD